jgi:hypothetical protein
MKKISPLLFLFSFVLINLVAAQNAWQIPQDSTSEWIIQQGQFNGDACYYNTLLRYFIAGDTLIASKSYSILHSSGEEWFSPTIPPYPEYCDNVHHPYSMPQGYIRSEDGKVYLMNPYSFEESLWYDFTLQVGDTLNWCGQSNGSVILEIDSIMFANLFHKIYKFVPPCANSPFDTLAIIEGIGFVGDFSTLDAYQAFSCYSEHGIILYGNPDCQLNVSVPNIARNNFFNVSSNPASKNFTITLNNLTEGQLLIRNCIGEVVRNLSLKDFDTANGISIDCSQWITGVYFISLIGSPAPLTQKIIVIN